MRWTSTMLVIWMFYLTTVCYESSEGMMSHLMADDLGRLYSMVQQESALKTRVRRATADEEDKRSPLPRLGARRAAAEGEEGEEEEEEDEERGNARDKRLPRFGREEEKEMDKRLPRLGIRSPLPRLGEEKEKRLPRLGIRSHLLPHLTSFRPTEGQEGDEEEGDEDFDGQFFEADDDDESAADREKRLPRFGLYSRRASPFPRLGRAAPFPRLGRTEAGKRAAPFPRLGRASPFPRLGRSREYYDFQEVEERAAPFPRLGRASPFPRLG